MKKILLTFLLFLFSNSVYAQASSGPQTPNNLGLSINILGPIFGEYGAGLYTFLNPYMQAGVNATYYATQYVSPEVEGWQTEFRFNYFFSTWFKNSFYIGATAGIESVDVKKDDNSQWKNYKDPTWSVIPGYSLVVGRSFITILGLSYGYSLGDSQFAPEINFVMFL